MPYPQNPYMNYQTGYQPQALPTMQSQASYPAPSSNGINWVSGESGAKSWIVGRGESVLLMDSESQCFYLKSADQFLTACGISERTEPVPCKPVATQSYTCIRGTEPVLLLWTDLCRVL